MQLRRESELARLRSDFIASVSHELRTPLAQVRMFAETLLLGRVRSEEERLRSLQIVDQEARRLTHLVENILQFSRAEREAIRLAPVPSRAGVAGARGGGGVRAGRALATRRRCRRHWRTTSSASSIRRAAADPPQSPRQRGEIRPTRPDGDDHASADGRPRADHRRRRRARHSDRSTAIASGSRINVSRAR